MKIENIFQNQNLHSQLSEKLLRALVEAGYSNTRPRQVVIRAIACSEGCFSPLEILRRGQLWHTRLGLATVYRTLSLLLSLGLVHRVHQERGCHSYALTERASEQRVTCECCRRQVPFIGGDLSFLWRAIAEETGYQIKGHRLEVFGLCPACQDKAEYFLKRE